MSAAPAIARLVSLCIVSPSGFASQQSDEPVLASGREFTDLEDWAPTVGAFDVLGRAKLPRHTTFTLPLRWDAYPRGGLTRIA
jgi:hypothetical protein